MRVLIVEDETLIALHLELMVESLGHRVCAIVAAPDEAASAAARWAPDLALVDLRLAGDTSGIDAVRGLRRWWQGIGVVFVSANLDPATRAELGMLEPLAMVAKPDRQRRARRRPGGGGPVSRTRRGGLRAPRAQLSRVGRPAGALPSARAPRSRPSAAASCRSSLGSSGT